MNAGLNQGFVNISASMSAELSGELDALQLNPSQGSDKFHSLFYNVPLYRAASALILPTNTNDSDYCQLFEMCGGLIQPPTSTGFSSTNVIGNHCFQSMFNNCEKLNKPMNLPMTSYAGW